MPCRQCGLEEHMGGCELEAFYSWQRYGRKVVKTAPPSPLIDADMPGVNEPPPLVQHIANSPLPSQSVNSPVLPQNVTPVDLAASTLRVQYFKDEAVENSDIPAFETKEQRTKRYNDNAKAKKIAKKALVKELVALPRVKLDSRGRKRTKKKAKPSGVNV